MLVLDDKKGGCKKTIKQGCFGHSLLERRKRVKRRERPEAKKHHYFYTVFGGLKNGKEVVPPFWAPKITFQNLLKPLFLMHFQEKLVVAIFRKRLC